MWTVSFLIPILLVLVVSPEKATSIRCYECQTNIVGGEHCADPFNSSANILQDCGSKDAIGCVKMSLDDAVLRSCAMRPYNTICDNVDYFCSVCNWDGCNSSSVIAPTVLLMVLAVIHSFVIGFSGLFK